MDGWVIGPKKTRLYINKVYAAPNTKVDAAKKVTQKLALKVLNKIINSPTNPDVPGNPTLDIANSTKNAAKIGIVFVMPPKSEIFLVCNFSYKIPNAKNNAPEPKA